MGVWYVENFTGGGFDNISAWQASTAYSVGDFVTQTSPSTSDDTRVFICIIAGTSDVGEPSWTISGGYLTTDNTVTWKEISGRPCVNGDDTNTDIWQASTNYSTHSEPIKNSSGTHYFVVSVDAGSSGATEPSWDTTTGNTTTDSGITWVCIGAVGDFSDWGAPCANIHSVTYDLTSYGDTVYVSDRHDVTVPDNYWRMLNKGIVVGVDHTNVPPTALASTKPFEGTSGGYGYLYGSGEYNNFEFTLGTQSYSGICSYNYSCELIVRNCNINIQNTSGAKIGYYSSSNYLYTSKLIMEDCSFALPTNPVNLFYCTSLVDVRIVNCNISGSNIPDNLCYISNNEWFGLKIEDCDFSNITGTLFNFYNGQQTVINMRNCKLGSGVTIFSGDIGRFGAYVRLVNCDSSDTNYRYYLAKYAGIAQQETTVVRSGGASDGTTPISWAVTTNANTAYASYFEADPIVVWNENTGSQLTATVEIAGAATLTDEDIWLDVSYSSDASSPKYSRADNRKAFFAAAQNHPTSSETWGGSPSSKQKLQVSFTPQNKGPIYARVYVAKPSATVYVDPMITLS